MKKQNEDIAVFLPPFEKKEFAMKLIGDSPLIIHAWSDKAKKEMLDKQMKKAAKGKGAKDPFMDFCDSMYWLSKKPENPTMEDVIKAKFGFPSNAFKLSAVDGGYRGKATKNMTDSISSFFVFGETDREMAEIKGIPEMREDMVRIGQAQTRTTDIRYRGQFKEWSVNLRIEYNPASMSMEQIINIFNIAGFSTGVGEWRPQRKGSYGMFHVAALDELD